MATNELAVRLSMGACGPGSWMYRAPWWGEAVSGTAVGLGTGACGLGSYTGITLGGQGQLWLGCWAGSGPTAAQDPLQWGKAAFWMPMVIGVGAHVLDRCMRLSHCVGHLVSLEDRVPPGFEHQDLSHFFQVYILGSQGICGVGTCVNIVK